MHMQLKLISNLDLLRLQYPGQVFLALDDAAAAMARPAKSVKNDFYLGVLPFPTAKIGRRRVVSLVDLAAYLDSLTAPAPARGPGRPRSPREGV